MPRAALAGLALLTIAPECAFAQAPGSEAGKAAGQELTLRVRQITNGPLHHFFGYIGHVQNVPWNKSGRYVLTLRTSVREHLPTGDEPAEIVLLDALDDFKPRVVAQTRAWNPQQGTMLYWNPAAQETQFFFNDRDPATNKVFLRAV